MSLQCLLHLIVEEAVEEGQEDTLLQLDETVIVIVIAYICK